LKLTRHFYDTKFIGEVSAYEGEDPGPCDFTPAVESGLERATFAISTVCEAPYWFISIWEHTSEGVVMCFKAVAVNFLDEYNCRVESMDNMP
jgi:hypothetical protein